MEKIFRKTLLYRSNVEYADYCINHVEGCAHGCKFPCYAMMMKKRVGVIKSYQEWIEPKIVANALELLDRELPKYKHKIKFVHLCFSTDPFMYRYPEVTDLSLKIIEKLSSNQIRSVVLTKGIYPDSLTNAEKYGINNEYGITLVSLNQEFREAFEPYSAPYIERIKSLEKLHSCGLRTWVSMEPYPTPNLVRQELSEILEHVSFVDKIIFGKLNYNVKSSHFEDQDDFYNECAEIFKEFCKDRNIEYHIKKGTQKVDNSRTKEIFNKYVPKGLNLQPALLRYIPCPEEL